MSLVGRVNRGCRDRESDSLARMARKTVHMVAGTVRACVGETRILGLEFGLTRW